MRLAIFLLTALCWAATVPVDLSGVRPGPVAVESAGGSLIVTWPDENARVWRAAFSLDPAQPLITSIARRQAHRGARASALLVLHWRAARRMGPVFRFSAQPSERHAPVHG